MKTTIENVIYWLNNISSPTTNFSEETLTVYSVKIKINDLRELLRSLVEDNWSICSEDLKGGHIIDREVNFTFHDIITLCELRQVCGATVIDRYRIRYDIGSKAWVRITRVQETDN